jgi:hypothetical protein
MVMTTNWYAYLDGGLYVGRGQPSGLNLVTEQLTQSGYPPDDANTLATLLLAHVRGLQLDLLLTSDRARADRAIEASIAMIDRTN